MHIKIRKKSIAQINKIIGTLNKEKLNIDIHAWINEAIEDKLSHDPASFLIKSIPNGTI